MRVSLTLALPKGRILTESLPFLAAAGVDLRTHLVEGERRLELEVGEFRVLLVKPVDVPTYVERGVAQIGIAGLDTIEEEGHDLLVPVDLGLAPCRMAVAERADRMPPPIGRRATVVRVATKYPRIARRYYRQRGQQTDIIPLFGSVELGPLTGLSDQIVDVVQSGETLRQNGLVEVDTIFESTARLIVHPASMKLQRSRMTEFLDDVRRAVAAVGSAPAADPASTPRRGSEALG